MRDRLPHHFLFPHRFFANTVRGLPAVPAYMLHQVDVPQFESLCATLERNRVRCITFPELLAGRGDANSILLTFDDGWSSVWSAALPIATRYGIRFTLFLAPRCAEESAEVRTTLATGAAIEEIAPRDLGPRARLTWGEVCALHASGVVDIQSHSTHHGVVFKSPKLRGFATPSGPFPLNGLAPLVQRVGTGDVVEFHPAPGTPLYEWGPALTVARRFIEPADIREKCVQRAREGGAGFFAEENWQASLRDIAEGSPEIESSPERWESDEARRERLRLDLEGSRRLIESRLPGAQVTVLAPPWAEVDATLPDIARDAGYRLLVLGYPFHVGHLESSLPLYPRLFGDASWISALGTIRGAPRWWHARSRALQRRRAGAVP
ncbi:MAG: polysaccharide deacetylase family protein [Gammaproteobacteria bacterium]